MSLLSSIIAGLFAFVVFLFTNFATVNSLAETKEDITQRIDRIGLKIDKMNDKLDRLIERQ